MSLDGVSIIQKSNVTWDQLGRIAMLKIILDTRCEHRKRFEGQSGHDCEFARPGVRGARGRFPEIEEHASAQRAVCSSQESSQKQRKDAFYEWLSP